MRVRFRRCFAFNEAECSFPRVAAFACSDVSLGSFALAVIGILASLTASAQTGNLTDAVSHPIPGAGHNYIGDLNETVNPANGALDIKIGLPVPKSRGLTMPFAITYSSGEAHQVTGHPGLTGGGYDLATATTRAQGGHGWSDTLPYVTAQLISAVVTVESSGQTSTGGYCPVSTSYNFYDMDGGSHMLDLAAIGALDETEYSTPITTGCTQAWIGTPNQTSSQPYYASAPSGGDDQVSASMEANCNGSPSNTVSDCGGALPSLNISDEHGNVYYFGANSTYIYPGQSPSTALMFPSKIEDRNGNIVNFTVPAKGSVGTLPVQDTVGRPLINESGGSTPSTPTTYTVGGLTYTVAYTSATANFSAASTLVNSAPNTNCTFTGSESQSYSAVQSIQLPNGQAYTFSYDPEFGLVNKITYPDGGWVSYQWEWSPVESTLATLTGIGPGGGAVAGACNFRYATPVISQRQVGFSSGSSAALTQTFTYNTNWTSAQSLTWSTKTTTVKTTDNVSGRVSQVIYTYGSVPQQFQINSPGSIQAQLPVETGIQTTDLGTTSAPGSTLLETVTKIWGDQFQMTGEQTVLAPASSSEIVYCYENGTDRISEKDEYDYGVAAPALSGSPTCGSPAPTRKTVYPGYAISGVPCQTIVYNSSGTRVAETDDYLDGGSAPCGTGSAATQAASTPSGTHDETSYGPGKATARGNPTAMIKWLNTGSSVVTTAIYDETGQILSTTDGCGNTSCSDLSGTNHTTAYQYTDSPSGGNSAGNSNAYLTQITDPLGHTQKFTYNYGSGELASATDANGQTTSYLYNDSLLRLTSTNFPDGGQTEICYVDPGGSQNNCSVSGARPMVETTRTGGVDPSVVSVTVMDGIGHVIQSQITSATPSTIYADTVYDGMGHVYSQSNPYYSTSDPTYGKTTFTYDALGRKILQLQPDQTSQSWSYSGNAVTFQDEASSQWRHFTDSLGRLTKVLEPSKTSKAPAVETDYTYDALDDLLSSTQQGISGETTRVRSFTYDSLSRLITAQNPESGYTCYGTVPSGQVPTASNCSEGYDANSNLTAKTDANGATISYTFDAVNRILQRNSAFNGTNLYRTFTYDQGTNGVGRLYQEYTLQQLGTQFSYDSMGRVVGTNWWNYEYAQVHSGSAWQTGMGVVYDKLGNPSQLTYPDGRVLTEAWDGAGRLSSVTDANTTASYFKASSTIIPGSIGAQYWATGALANAQIGSYIFESTSLNNREQLCRTAATTSLVATNSNGGNVLDRQNYFISPAASPCGNQSGNNGNIYSIVDNLQTTMAQSFGYDNLNRLTAASRADGVFNYTYNYDSFGNMLLQDNIHGSLNYSIDPATNRLLLNTSAFTYDAAGHLTSTPNPLGGTHQYGYDNEGSLRSIDGYGTGSYLYNGLGERGLDQRNASSNSTWNEYVYLNGQMMADVDYLGNWTDYIYANGEKVARVEAAAAPIHLSGTVCSNCGGSSTYIQLTAGAGRVLKSGDTLYLSQYTVGGAEGGVILNFTDGTVANGTVYDQGGNQINCDGVKNQWHQREINLSSFAGKTLASTYLINDICSAGGQFDIFFNDVAISGNGSTSTIYTSQPGATFTPVDSSAWPGKATNVTAIAQANTFSPTPGVHFYVHDQVGTAQMELAGAGWPTWQGQFTPFGQEIVNGSTTNVLGQQPADGTNMRYKFTGHEEDAESGLGYFGARYYASTMGRFISPDWADKPTAVPYATLSDPQSLNLYSYVRNRPVSLADPDGHWATPDPTPPEAQQEDYNAYASGGQKPHQSKPQAQQQSAPAPAPTPNPNGSVPAPAPGKAPGWKPGDPLTPNEWVPVDSGKGSRDKWGPKFPIPGQSQPGASWDAPNGHWDNPDGKGNTSRWLPGGGKVDHWNNPLMNAFIKVTVWGMIQAIRLDQSVNTPCSCSQKPQGGPAAVPAPQ